MIPHSPKKKKIQFVALSLLLKCNTEEKGMYVFLFMHPYPHQKKAFILSKVTLCYYNVT